MKFHREGYQSLLLVLVFAIVLNSSIYLFLNDYPSIRIAGYVVSAFLLVVILQFFRNPTRNFMAVDNAIISPADGKVVVIEEVGVLSGNRLRYRCMDKLDEVQNQQSVRRKRLTL
jgi:phosphatidylserine decarboxylase